MSREDRAPRWVVEGPCYADGWYLVQNRNAVIPQLTDQWFHSRASARAYRRALMAGRWRQAAKLRKEHV